MGSEGSRGAEDIIISSLYRYYCYGHLVEVVVRVFMPDGARGDGRSDCRVGTHVLVPCGCTMCSAPRGVGGVGVTGLTGGIVPVS